jgi:predicted DNA-binding transcriptional regulator YafY
MNSKEILAIERLDYLICSKTTGTREDLSAKFNVSIRTISRWLEFMNESGAVIKYSRTRRSFYYLNPGKFIVNIGFKPISEKQPEALAGSDS